MAENNYRVLLEPKGFIRLLELFLAILAFSTACGFKGSGSFTVNCAGGTQNQEIKVWYPYTLVEQVTYPEDVCVENSTILHAVANSSGSSQFFVFIGVWAMLTCLATCILYVAFDELVQVLQWPITADLLHSGVLALLWLISSCAWASGVTTVKQETNMVRIAGSQPKCTGNGNCQAMDMGYASLNVSVIFGFLCFAVWVGNLWFLVKETQWWQQREAAKAGQSQVPQPQPSVPSSSFSGAPVPPTGQGLPAYPTQSPFAAPGDPAFMQQPSASQI